MRGRILGVSVLSDIKEPVKGTMRVSLGKFSLNVYFLLLKKMSDLNDIENAPVISLTPSLQLVSFPNII